MLKRDLFLASALAVVAFLAAAVWSVPGVPPGAWEDYAIVVGVRPAVHVARGYCTFLSWLVNAVGGPAVLKCVGHAFLAAVAACAYLICRELLTLLMVGRPQQSRLRPCVTTVASALASLCLVFSGPVWVEGQFFTEDGLLTLLVVLSVGLFLSFLKWGRLFHVVLLGLLLGALAAESFVGIVLLVVFVGVAAVVVKSLPEAESRILNPASLALFRWMFTLLFLTGLGVGVAVNLEVFRGFGGMRVDGVGSLPLKYISDYWGFLSNAATIGGWMLWTLVFLLPCIGLIVRFPSAADEETPLGYVTGIVVACCGTIAASQCCGFPALWFWTYFPVKSGHLLSLGVFMAIMAIALSLVVVGVETFCRDHRRLARLFMGEDSVELSPPRHNAVFLRILRVLAFLLVPFLLAAVVAPVMPRASLVELSKVANDAVDAMVAESEGARIMFTDGCLDAALEVEARRLGQDLTCVSLMGGDAPFDVYLRTRALEGDGEDRYALGLDGGVCLRTWIRDKPERLHDVACQLGFDLWKREGKAIPPVGGFLSRPTGWDDPSVRTKGVDAAHALAERILDIHSRRLPNTCADRSVMGAFSAVQWRVARMCLYRAENLDHAGDAEGALKEVDLAKRLNGCNETFLRITSIMQRRSEKMQSRLTPREGLQLALSRADFRMAKVFSDVILNGDEDDPDANFAQAMYYVRTKQFARAAEFLKRALIRRPNEPALYNNLAMVELEMGELESAQKHANKALELMPESSEVKNTLSRIRAARSAVRTNSGGE